MSNVLDETVERSILDAICPEDVFGLTVTPDAIKSTYTQLVKIVHPDKFNGTIYEKRSNEVFVKLAHLKDEGIRKIKLGSYGKRVAAPPPPSLNLEVRVGKNHYLVKEMLRQEEFCDIYACLQGDDPLVFKVTQAATENDLLDNEIKILKYLYPEGQADEKFYRYLPKVLDSFMLKGKTARRAVIFPSFPTYRTLAEVIRVFPAGLDFRDMVWMYKRILVGLGFAHSKGVIHGAVIPPYMFIDPTSHGAKLTAWYHAVQGNDHIKAISNDYRAYYPPEVFDKKPPSAATDIFMATKCAIALVGGDPATGAMPDTVPSQLRAFLSSCILASQAKRPSNAWDLHDEFDELLKKLVGKRSYRKLTMP